ncbi:MAG: hypothetical protein BWK80_47440 [Desulfobacteraceae bacterium IS3]|nr:MAG: hypothetical protein BWK80_47440 [Desulfobacteraceae bacterium IS3]
MFDILKSWNMKRTTCIQKYLFFLFLLLFIVLPVKNGLAEDVNFEKAKTVAKNWLTEYVRNFGSWAGSKNPEIASLYIITSEGQITGYNFIVSPAGHIIIQSRDELFPVKLYSETNRLDFSSTADEKDEVKKWLRKELSEQVKFLKKNERSRSPRTFPKKELWDYLSDDVSRFSSEKRTTRSDVLSIGPLLTTKWSQGDPYNRQCPYDSVKNCQTIVGCVATATAQILKYWSYPPDKYDWNNMPDKLFSYSSQAEIDAVSRLCADIGVSVGMDYGCEASSAYISDVAASLQNFLSDKFHSLNATYKTREYDYKECTFDIFGLCIFSKTVIAYYSAGEWLDKFFKPEITAERPVLFGIVGDGGHAVVADGYETSAGGTYIHINFGWGGYSFFDGWYTPDDIPDYSNTNRQTIVVGITPYCDFNISMSSQNFPTTATGNGSISITAATSDKCRWSASTSDSWITFTSGNTGIGNGTLSYAVGYNSTGAERTGTITVSGKKFTVTQGAVPIGAVLATVNSILFEDDENEIPIGAVLAVINSILFEDEIIVNNSVNLADAVEAMKIVVGNSSNLHINIRADVNKDNKIGLEDAICILQMVSGLRIISE